MRPYLVFMSHGQLAAEVKMSAQMIVGEITDLSVVSMTEDDGLAGTKEKLDTILAQIPNEQSVLILADLKGGTPCNVAMMNLSKRANIKLVSGLNLAMAIEAAVSNSDNVEELANHMVTVGKAAVMQVALPTELSEDGFED